MRERAEYSGAEFWVGARVCDYVLQPVRTPEIQLLVASYLPTRSLLPGNERGALVPVLRLWFGLCYDHTGCARKKPHFLKNLIPNSVVL